MSLKTDLIGRAYFWPETILWRKLAWRCGLDREDDHLLPVLLALLLNCN